MSFPDKKWYRLAEVAERWEKTQTDIEHYLETCRLWAVVKLSSCIIQRDPIPNCDRGDKHIVGSGRYEIADFKRILWDCNGDCDFLKVNVHVRRMSGNPRMYHDKWVEEYEETGISLRSLWRKLGYHPRYRFISPNIVNKNDIIIPSEEVTEFEEQYDIRPENRIISTNEITNPKSPGCPSDASEELRAAINAHEATRSFINKAAHKQEAERWLYAHRKDYEGKLKGEGLSADAIERISTVVNTCPKGGRRKSINR